MFDMICLLVGTLGFLFGARCYLELWRWARQCQGARIAIAYKGKVKLQAPLVEWLLWCNQVDRDKHSNGRVVYTMGGTSVAITRAVVPGRGRDWWRVIRGISRRKTNTQAPPAKVIQGTWKATDETKAVK